jgi:hypothetical protein
MADKGDSYFAQLPDAVVMNELNTLLSHPVSSQARLAARVLEQFMAAIVKAHPSSRILAEIHESYVHGLAEGSDRANFKLAIGTALVRVTSAAMMSVEYCQQSAPYDVARVVDLARRGPLTWSSFQPIVLYLGSVAAMCARAPMVLAVMDKVEAQVYRHDVDGKLDGAFFNDHEPALKYMLTHAAQIDSTLLHEIVRLYSGGTDKEAKAKMAAVTIVMHSCSPARMCMADYGVRAPTAVEINGFASDTHRPRYTSIAFALISMFSRPIHRHFVSPLDAAYERALAGVACV